ncbi:MAG TPA: radical SAM protein [Candidatus Saccharicenans sp.]|nr:radical SAM protein [Candidatus Saccharicenans sp.]
MKSCLEPGRRRFLKTGLGCLTLGLLGLLRTLLAKIQKSEPRDGASVSGNFHSQGEDMSEAYFEPAYLKLHQSGELKRRGQQLWEIMKKCRLCPRECEKDRLARVKGDCQSDDRLKISAFHPHFGEERSLVGSGGSGTIFLSNCSLKCVYCINWEISQGGSGRFRTLEEMAGMMLELQRIGCHNINLVTPTHFLPHILLALDMAAARGLRLPVVYNTHGWEKEETLKYLDGVVDIYLPDFKYWHSSVASRLSSGAGSYPEIARKAMLEMNRQVGVAHPAGNGLMYRGLMIRHLVLPNRMAGSKEILSWIAQNLPKDTYINIMSQYQPAYKAHQYPHIARRITRAEYKEVVEWAKSLGLTNLDIQGLWW